MLYIFPALLVLLAECFIFCIYRFFTLLHQERKAVEEDEIMTTKYAVTLMAKKRTGLYGVFTVEEELWEIFEDGQSWGVTYPSFAEAYEALRSIHDLTEKAALTKNN